MKKFFLILLVLIALVGGGVYFAIQKYVNVDEIRTRVVAIVKEKTGRDIAFSRLRVMPMMNPFPYLLVKLQDVTFSNATWASEKNMAALGAIEVNVALKPLLDKKVEVTKFILDQPVINLEISVDGQKNWEFPKAKEEKKEETGGTPSPVGGAVDSLKKDIRFSFSQFEVRKGEINFVDRKSRNGVALSKMDLNLNYPDFASAVQLDGWFEYLGRKVNLFANLEKPLDLVNGKPSAGKVTLKSEGTLDVTAEGTLATAGTMVNGDISADIPSLETLLSWLTGGKEKKMPFRHISFSSKAKLTADALSLDKAKLALDEIEAMGDVSLGLAGPKPSFKAVMALNHLDLDRFTGGEEKEGGKPAGAGGGKAAGATEWDDTPIDFSGLRAVNADLILRTKGFSLRGAELGASTLTVTLQDGNLKFKNSETTLFSGKFLCDLSVNAVSKTPQMMFKFGMDGVDAKPVLTTFAKFDKLTGTADAAVELASSGSSQRSIINNLTGRGNVVFRNGSLKGIDFVNILMAIQSHLSEMGVGEGKTDFVDLGGTFIIENGVAKNDDLKMRGPMVQATGSGTFDLPKKWVNYRALPVLTASSAKENAGGFQVPVNIRGPFHNIKVRPDYAATIGKLLDSPEGAQETIKNAKETGKEIIKDFKKDPGGALDSLLGGGLFKKKKKPADGDPMTDPNMSPGMEPAPAP